MRIIAAAGLLAACLISEHIFKLPRAVNFAFCLVPYLIIGYDILLKAFRGIVNGQVFDENFLMAVATIGAIILGEYTEASAVMLFYQIGELFQSCAVGKSRRNISALMDIRPDSANIERDGEIISVDPDEVEIGSEIIVRAGEKIPIDGVISNGTSTLDTAALTGESIPKDVEEGDEVHSGCINMTGLIKIRTTKEFGESTASKILELVENSGEKKSKSENFISKFAKYYTPAVCFTALALALLVPIFMTITGRSPEWGKWVMRALTFLVISCPCALVISIPLTFFAGIGGAGANGILIKGSNYIETLSKTKYVLFDKTGTMTKGVFEVSGVHHNTIDKERLIEYAALAESGSNHPIAKSIRGAYGMSIDETRVSGVKETAGQGVTALVDGCEAAVGNEKLMENVGADYKPCSGAGTTVHVAVGGEYAGHILVSDTVKNEAFTALRELKKAGVRKTVMLTGDGEKTAKAVAEQIGADEVFCSLLPDDKVKITEKFLKEKKRGEALVFVGDGLNDAPVISLADVGIAMGALGSDAAIEAADVVLMDDDPLKISQSIKISRKCMRIVYENIIFAIGVKLVCLAMGALGIADMWAAIFADVGVMIIAVLNSIRALHA